MLKRQIGNSGLDASVVAFGAWAIGGWMWGGADEKDAIDAIHAAIDEGINFIDTAPIYGFGRSESIVGKALKGKRDKVIIATKCGMRWDRECGDFYFNATEKGVTQEDGDYKVYKCLKPESIREEIENTLRRLDTDYVDLYQTHWQETTTPIDDTVAELNKLKDEGKIRAIGVSNVTVDHLKQYGPIASAQQKYNMLQRDVETDGVRDYCDERNIAILAYSPLAQGLLTGKFSADRSFNEGDVRNMNPLFDPENIKKVNQMLDEFREIGDKYGATLAQLVTAWSFSQRGITHILAGARNAQQVKDNAGAGRIELATEDIQAMSVILKKYF